MKLTNKLAAIILTSALTPAFTFADVALYTLKTENHSPFNMVVADLDSDSKNDFIIAGRTLGAPNTVRRISENGANVLWTVTAPTISVPYVYNARDFGHAMVVVPDANNDGVKDIAVSAPNVNYPNQRGEIFLLSGVNGAILRTFNPVGVAGDKKGESLAHLANNLLVACGSGALATSNANCTI
jgi:hypothetical protein